MIKKNNFKVGDIFYVPLNYLKEYEVINNQEDGNYIPNPADIVCFGQIVVADKKGICTVVFFETNSIQKEIESISLDTIINKKVIYICSMVPLCFSNGWWPIIGNRKISFSIPLQAYNWNDTQVYDHHGLEGGNSKEINSRIAKKLLPAGVTYTNGVLEEVLRYHFKIIKKPFPNNQSFGKKEIQALKPRKEGLVWNIFPELKTEEEIRRQNEKKP